MSKNSNISGFEDRLDSIKESVRSLVDYGGDRAGALKDKMIDVKDTVVSGSKSGAQRIGMFIKDHPIIALGIAFGVGYAAMRLMRR